MPNLAKYEDCTGCAACFSVCGKGVIKMRSDNTGFLFPKIDMQKCIECGLCEKSCPVITPVHKDSKLNNPHAYLLQHKNDTIRAESTSGGAFTAIAEETISNGGIVFGASLEDDLVVRHIGVEKSEDLIKFRNSKYVQSEIGNSFIEVKTQLLKGRKVCFSGTPCQISGLKNYLRKDYPNLITVDFACNSVPSPLILKKYIELKTEELGEFKRIVFRDKHRGYSYSTMSLYKDWNYQKSGKYLYRRGSESDEWLRLFLNGQSVRLSCFNCQFQDDARVADISIADMWDPSKIAPDMNDNKGTTTIAVWTEKGREMINAISNDVRLFEYAIEDSSWVRPHNKKEPPNFDRNQFYDDANAFSPKEFFQKYAPDGLSTKIKQTIRMLMWKIGLYDLIRNTKHYLVKRKKQ